METQSIKFDTLPLWICFNGLELEHHSTEIVRMIASAAGSVSEVLPVGVIPRAAEGYRARVNVLVHLPLVNTLTKGDVWVGFKYNGLPPLYCLICRRLGHVRHNCEYPRTTPRDEGLLMIGFHGDEQPPGNSGPATVSQNQSSAMDCLGIWPHDTIHPAGSSELGQTSQAQHVLDTTHLNTQTIGPVLAIETLAHNPSPKLDLSHPTQPDLFSPPTEVNQIPIFHYTTETPQPPSVDNTLATPRRRGRPTGSTNKAPKQFQSDKGKLPIASESHDAGIKKRKLSETSDPDVYIPNLSYELQPENPSSFSINFIRQLLQHPQTAALLAKDGIINPNILTIFFEPNETPTSPISVFQGPYAPDSYVEHTEEGSNTRHLLMGPVVGEAYTDLDGTLTPCNPSGGLVTFDPSGGLERRITPQNADLIDDNSITLPGSSLLYTPSSDLHSEELKLASQNLRKLQNAKASGLQFKEQFGSS